VTTACPPCSRCALLLMVSIFVFVLSHARRIQRA
jgi:hypothetical protein